MFLFSCGSNPHCHLTVNSSTKEKSARKSMAQPVPTLLSRDESSSVMYCRVASSCVASSRVELRRVASSKRIVKQAKKVSLSQIASSRVVFCSVE
jgi:hypothetical protein